MPTVAEARDRLVSFVADRGDTIGKTLDEHLAALESAIREEERAKGACDICAGTRETANGDLCVCRDGTALGAVTNHFRLQLFDMREALRESKVRVLEEVERRAIQMRDADHGNEVPADYYYGAALGEMLSEARGASEMVGGSANPVSPLLARDVTPVSPQAGDRAGRSAAPAGMLPGRASGTRPPSEQPTPEPEHACDCGCHEQRPWCGVCGPTNHAKSKERSERCPSCEVDSITCSPGCTLKHDWCDDPWHSRKED